MKKILNLLYYFPNWVSLKLNKVQHQRYRISGFVLIRNQGTLIWGDEIKINSSSYANVIGGDVRSSMVVKQGAILQIGRNVMIANSAIYCANRVTIEDDVMIGGSCKIWDSDFHPLDPVQRKVDPNNHFNTRPVHIKRSAFIGGSSLILKGVTVGANSIVGAGSVVTRSIPDNEIWGGNPAVFIKKVTTHDQAI